MSKKKMTGDIAHKRTSCADYAAVLTAMENHMVLLGNALGTQKPYIRAVRDLMESSKSVPELLSADQIKAHLVGFRGKISSSALNLRVCGIKYYFRFIVKRLDLVVDIPNPRVAKYVQDVLSEAELLLLLDSCRSMREQAMLSLLFDTGLRSREVCGLRLRDFNRVKMTVTVVNGKGDKLRTIPYSEELRTSLKAYFNSLSAYPSAYLFENKEKPGTPITIRGVQYIVKEVVKRSRLKKEIHPHSFRHSFAIHYINNGGNILRLKELMGHADIESTFHYLKFCSIPLTDTPTPLAMLLRRKAEKEAKAKAEVQAKAEADAKAQAVQAAQSKGGNSQKP